MEEQIAKPEWEKELGVDGGSEENEEQPKRRLLLPEGHQRGATI